MNTRTLALAQNLIKEMELDPLEALMAESRPKSSLFDLDDLLADSMKQKKEAEAVKQARNLLSQKGVDPEARKRMQAQILEHEMKVQWTAQAAVAMFDRQWCDECDCCHIQFTGYFQRQTHRYSKIDRWLKSTKQQMAGLPKETKYEDSVVETCEECAGLAGYPIDDDYETLDPEQQAEAGLQAELQHVNKEG